MKNLLYLALGFFAGCTQTVFYKDGKAIARFTGDMKNSDFEMNPSGSLKWTVETLDHSTTVKARGQSVQTFLRTQTF